MPLNLNDVKSGYNLSAINSNFKKIEQAWDEKLDRLSSTQENSMKQDLDMNGRRLLNAVVGDSSLSDVVNEAEGFANTAKASANFKGVWSDLTGPISIPATVSHKDTIWMLLRNLSDITASEPTSTSDDWQEVDGLAEGVAQEGVLGINIFPRSTRRTASTNPGDNEVPVGTAALRDRESVYAIVPTPNLNAGDLLTALDFTNGTATIGSNNYRLFKYAEVLFERQVGDVGASGSYTDQNIDFKRSSLQISVSNALKLTGGNNLKDLTIFRADADFISNPLVVSGKHNTIEGLKSKYVTRDFGQNILLSDADNVTIKDSYFEKQGYQILQSTGHYANSVRVLNNTATQSLNDFVNVNNDSQAGISYDWNVSDNVVNHEGSIRPYGSTETRGIGFTTVYGGRAVNNSMLNIRGDAASHCENVNEIVYGFNYYKDCFRDYLHSGAINRKWVRLNTISGVEPVAVGDVITGSSSGASGTILFWMADARLAWLRNATGTWTRGESFTIAGKATTGTVHFEDRVQSHVNKIGNIHHKTNTQTTVCNDYGSNNYGIRAHEIGESYLGQFTFGANVRAINAALAFDLNLSHSSYRGFDIAIDGGTQMIQMSNRYSYSWGNLFHVKSAVATRCTFQGNTYWEGEFQIRDSRQCLYQDLKFLPGSVINIDSTTRDNIWKDNLVSSQTTITNLDVNDFTTWKSSRYDKELDTHKLKLRDNILGAGQDLLATVVPLAGNTTCSLDWNVSTRSGTNQGISKGAAIITWNPSKVPTVTLDPSNWSVGSVTLELAISGQNLLIRVKSTAGVDNIYTGYVNVNTNGTTLTPVTFLDTV